MKRYVDLHLHSNFSDGVHAPAEVVRMAAQAGLTAIALCDHDNIDGIDQAMAAGQALGVEVLSGVELSALWESYEDIHLLGYGFDHQHAGLKQTLAEFREFRERRNEHIVARVNEKLLSEGRATIEFEAVRDKAGGTVGRPHIAMALLDAGHVKGTEDAFVRYLVPCNVPKCYWPMQDAIREIQRLGGVAVLAHPTTVSNDRQGLRDIITELAEMGLDGVEAFNNMAQQDEMEFLRRLAGELGLLVTGGSDFHGIEEGLQMGRGRGGVRFSDTLLAPLRKRFSARKNQLLSL